MIAGSKLITARVPLDAIRLEHAPRGYCGATRGAAVP